MKRILITGGAGFIGSNFVEYLLDRYLEYEIVNLDLLTYAGSLENLKEVMDNPRHKFIKGDIRDRELLQKIFRDYDIRGVIHFAAESHVDNSIKNPGVFIETNINGTFNLIDVAYRYWMKAPFTTNRGYEECRFHHISTDEVYGSLGDKGFFTEDTPYAPNSPYSASKASSDMIVRSYIHTYGLNAVITNCSNNYGAKQHDEKLIPTIIRNAIEQKPIPIYGDGKNIRDWLYVLDHCRGIDLVYHKAQNGESYNIGARNEMTNIQIAHKICSTLDRLIPLPRGSYLDLIAFVEDRAGHDKRYAIDSSKIERELHWKPQDSFDSAIIKTIKWYLKQYNKI